MTIGAGETAFVDTNVLLCATDRSRSHHLRATLLPSTARHAGFGLALSGQIIREYLVVATRPVEVNGLGLSRADAHHNIQAFSSRVELCGETEAVSRRLLSLVDDHCLVGKRIHDANLVATMAVHGIRWLITEDSAGFQAFSEIQTLGLADLPTETDEGSSPRAG